MESVCITYLPTLVLCKILDLLDAESISQISETCSLFRGMVKHYYILLVKLTNEDNQHVHVNESKKVLKLRLNIVSSAKSDNEDNFVKTSLFHMFTKLKILNLMDTTEVSMNFYFIDENVIMFLRDNISDLQSLIHSMKNLQ